jgi:predicted small secreted protein
MALVLFTLMLAGCNATAGAGRDISAAGNAITNDANSSKEY